MRGYRGLNLHKQNANGDCPVFLRAPPFPGTKSGLLLASEARTLINSDNCDVTALVATLRAARVGSDYWAAHPAIDRSNCVILKPADPIQAAEMMQAAKAQNHGAWLTWHAQPGSAAPTSDEISCIAGLCDPWYVLDHAAELWADGDDEALLVAALLGRPVRPFGKVGRFTALADRSETTLEQVVARELVHGITWLNPFTHAATTIDEIVALCAGWRTLIDSNRPIAAAFGFGHWKQDTVDALLWNGNGDHAPFASAHTNRLDALPNDVGIALWKARVPEQFLAACEKRTGPLFEAEDGFIRSAGLGADCVPPLSIILDPLGVHYDPSRPSTLETMLADDEFSTDMLDRARKLRKIIVESGVSKYEVGGQPLARPGGLKRHILVPGQVEDDRSVLAGSGEVRGNLDLLRRARAAEPQAYILYKPHPDVLAGHRKGHVAPADALRFADDIVTEHSISALLDMVDDVHVMTSLAGFEALLRGKNVTTHGVPFYAGWGLTRDFGAVPERRVRARTIDELVAATLLLYPRYLDPATGLPCPPEILIERLVDGMKRENRAVVMLRRTQGNLRRMISRLGFAA